MNKVKKKVEIAKTSTEATRMLWQKDFFKKERELKTIIEKLASEGYNFVKANLSKALGRAKFLTKKGKRGKFKYIQKHPFIDEQDK